METEGTTQEKGTLGQHADKNNQVRQAIIQSLNVWHGASYESLQPRGKKLLLSKRNRLPFWDLQEGQQIGISPPPPLSKGMTQSSCCTAEDDITMYHLHAKGGGRGGGSGRT